MRQNDLRVTPILIAARVMFPPACIYVVVGLGRNGLKRILACIPKFGRKSLEEWKAILRGLIERGLRRVLLIVHDDFSGLLPITKGLFPQTSIQLCIVHMQRNATHHLSREDAAELNQRLRTLRPRGSPGLRQSPPESADSADDAALEVGWPPVPPENLRNFRKSA
jgi:transposase-like protein